MPFSGFIPHRVQAEVEGEGPSRPGRPAALLELQPLLRTPVAAAPSTPEHHFSSRAECRSAECMAWRAEGGDKSPRR